MKKQLHYFTTLSLLVVSIIPYAQVTLTDTGINPLVGENHTYARGAYANPGNAGINQTWDLSVLSGTIYGPTNVLLPSNTTNGASFPNANVAWDNYMEITNTYFKTTAVALEVHGSFKNNKLIIHSNPEEILHYPFTHNDTYIDPWSAQYTSGPYTYYQRGTTTVTADGYGTLITPTGTYINVMRVHFVQSYIDSTYAAGLPLKTTNTNDEYRWYTNGVHEPIASVFTFNNNLGGTTTGSSYLSNSTVGLKESQKASFDMSVYPNPVSNLLTVSFKSANKKIEIKIVNTLGATVKHSSIQDGISTIAIDSKELPNGIYFAQIILNGTVAETKRFVVSK